MKKFLVLLLTLCSFSGMIYSDISWSSPTTISTALTDASDPQIVIHTNGDATAVWIENNVIKASSLPFGGSWTAPTSISNVLNTSSSPKLGIDSSGNVTAVWIENTFIKSARLPFGGSWSSASFVSGLGATTPALAVDSTDHAIVIWTRGGFIESATRTSGLWSLVSVLSVTNSSNPHIAVNNSGKAIAGWHSVVAGADVIVTNILTIASNTWGVAKNVFNATASFFHNYPKVAIDSGGNSLVIWYRYNFQSSAYQNVQVITSSLANGAAAWGNVSLFANAGIRNPADLTIKLKFDASGDAVAVWTNSYDGETFSTESARKLFGGSWPLSILLQVPSIYSFGMDVAIANGTALFTNMAWDEVSAIQILSQESDTTDPVLQGWTPTTILSSGDGNGYPKCAISATGSTLNAAVVWIHFDGANNVINASTGSDTVISPPSSVSASQSVTDFGVYQDYFNTITWNASSDPDVIQYNIYRNGVFFNATDPSTLQFIDNNTVQGGTVTYGVAALTSNFRQSAIINFQLN
jgi:hypothetical protein